jgi:5-oxopent-3-ene-1,2,5-tricarboxylate decarboxylase/2-hydroxyhepta-2,4-diene-1,7-dioate isomerase
VKHVRFAAEGTVQVGESRDGRLWDRAGRAYDPESVVWLPPIVPTKVIGLALNYAEHAAELGIQPPKRSRCSSSRLPRSSATALR